MGIKEQIKSMNPDINEEDLLWHIKATKRELEQYYNGAANAITRINAIERSITKILEELKMRRDLPEFDE